jgi:DNA polymerase I-like protein with 3'-5' exonuclease and polymerase domains
VIVADFESHGIEPRPDYPPKPVSLALKWPDEREYRLMAWGHEAGGNNCTEKEARGQLKRAYDSKYPLLWQNYKFDGDVAETYWDLPLLPEDKWHDTLYLLFMYDPHAPSLSLKPAAERLLGIAPEEQDRMYEWIIANVPEAKRKPSTAGAYIWKAPYQIVKPYHKGDLVRTLKLFNFLYPQIADMDMLDAYRRERKLMPILLRNERRGMRLDMDGLEHERPLLKAGLDKADAWLRKRLGVENLDSDKQLGNALWEKGILTSIKHTAKGQIAVGKNVLTIDKFKDKKVYQVLKYRSQMATSLNMFIDPWLELGTTGKGRIFPNWSQVRAPKGDSRDTAGARSGRIICSKPNFLNIPKKWKRSLSAGYKHPDWLKVPQLPYIRTFCLPEKGKQWGRRDFNQQEVRLYAHFEEGLVRDGFLNDPDFDIHELVRGEAEHRLVEARLRDHFDRDSAKGCVFGRFYGQGLPGLMETLKLTEEDKEVARIVQKAINTAVPTLRELNNELKALAKEGRPIRTWGGRLYYCEPPSYNKKYGRDMTYEYKLISYLIQGSGADVMKEALIRYDEHPKRQEEFIVTVYDELNNNLPLSHKGATQEMKVLEECMASIETEVPMLSEGERGPAWGLTEKMDA